MKPLMLLISLFYASTLLSGAMKETQLSQVSICIDRDLISTDPRRATTFSSGQIVRMLSSGLLEKEGSGKIIPALARSYTLSDDKKTYTFTLKKTSWSNGDPVTAHDFARAWLTTIDPKRGHHLACDFFAIKNARACAEGKCPLSEVGIQVKDPYTLAVTLEYPNPYFPSFVASPTYLPIHKSADSFEKTPLISNGPFLLNHWKQGYEIAFKKNPTYWDAGRVKLKSLRMEIISDPLTALGLYRRGKLDYIGAPLSLFVNIDQLSKKASINQTAIASVSCLMLRTDLYPLTNKHFRQALSAAIDRQAIADHILRLEGTPATGFLSGCLKVSKRNYLEKKQERAKELFDKALKELGISRKQLPTLTLSYRSLPQTERVIVAIQEQWSRILGLQVELKKADHATHISNLHAGNYQIGEVSWRSKSYDPSYVLSFFREKTLKTNLCRFDCKPYDALLTQAEREVNEQKRKQLLAQAEALLLDEMPLIPIYFAHALWMQHARLQGVTVSDLGEIDFKGACLK